MMIEFTPCAPQQIDADGAFGASGKTSMHFDVYNDVYGVYNGLMMIDCTRSTQSSGNTNRGDRKMANNKTVFVRTERAPKNALRGQAALVLEAIAARPDGGTIETIAKDVTPTMVTRQDPERVVAYYACIFKKQGLVRATAAPVEPEENDEDTDDEDLDDEDTDESDIEVEDEELEETE